MLTTLIPAAIACCTSGTRAVPTMGWVMMPWYLPEEMAVCSWLYWVFELLAASKTVILMPFFAATASALASMPLS